MLMLLPDGHSLRMATGESRGPVVDAGRRGGRWCWPIAPGCGGCAARAQAVESAAPAPGSFTDTELDRYARHIVLREIGGPGQKALREARVLVIGGGGLGSPVLLYLAAAGVGTIGVIDDDVVDNSNLQRQVVHRDADIGRPKVQSALRAMQAQNPSVTVRPYHRRLTPEIADDLFADYDLILDGTDNFDTRYLANAAAVRRGQAADFRRPFAMGGAD